ncbi:alpha-L-fucosidase 2 [Anaerocolumna jejuensis DSM 15929]|uniref:Alpha-L-fucosidase 2 n=1 Tax=Anaerocolumna jejuensis DSM 15929 TaxID=1121322 RepID=A0A1M6V8Z6_9FIRM|nr:glycoside hydrolase family 95 protein [Anaerocolumna jejuensis]SHK77952.1 alpha-L-fucosidase 2 [Anaerocolumna jejuensis DSM 15929]
MNKTIRPEHVMHYKTHANSFFEALPVGNGRLGGMVFGHPQKDTIILNDSTMWSGSPQDSDRPDAHRYLPEIRRLLLEGRNYEAQELFSRHFTCQGDGTMFANGANGAFGCYQVLGSLRFFFFQAISFSHQSGDDIKDYTRELNLEEARARVHFRNYTGDYTREYLCSCPDQVLAAHFTAKKPGSIHFALTLDREENFETSILPDMTLQMTGQLHDGKEGHGVKYACHVRISAVGGKVFANSGRLCVTGADEATVYVTAATNMQGFLGRNIRDEIAASLSEMEGAEKKGWSAIERDHLQNFQNLYKRNEIAFAKPFDYTDMDLKQRVLGYSPEKEDYGLIELYYHYARYLLISSSREDGLPCNLQGIWAQEIQTPWNGDWHLNAQQELYWLAETGNLSECHVPYLKLTKELVEPGRRTAKAYYNMRGWLAHTCTNPWGFTSPCEDASWGSTTGSAAWQCHHLWNHYLYTCDKQYLEWAYPIMKEAALFYLDMLVEEPEHHYLVTSPSSSPENWFYDEEGRMTALCMGPAYDTELVKSLFEYCIQAGKVLGQDKEFITLLRDKVRQMAPIQITSDGRIMEWLKEYREALVHHRHLSHLWGLYPGFLISREQTPELAQAAEKSLESRGITTAGWANAYRFAAWAKLRNPDKAYEALTMAFRAATSQNLLNLAFHCDENAEEPELPDIADNFYPFQMDGNEGHSAGIALMLADDQAELLEDGSMRIAIYLKPALPKQLSEGYVKGLKLKGGFELSYSWKKDGTVEGTLKNLCGNSAAVFLGGEVIAESSRTGEVRITCPVQPLDTTGHNRDDKI